MILLGGVAYEKRSSYRIYVREIMRTVFFFNLMIFSNNRNDIRNK